MAWPASCRGVNRNYPKNCPLVGVGAPRLEAWKTVTFVQRLTVLGSRTSSGGVLTDRLTEFLIIKRRKLGVSCCEHSS
jgi:hypothetical protein